jgi:hypothetical protein
MTRIRSAAAALLAAATLAACGDESGPQDILGSAPSSQVRFFNYGVNAPGVNFYANNAKLTAISSVTGQEATTGTAFGQAAAGGRYLGITPGQYTFSGRIAAATDKDLAVATAATSVESGKNYSFYMSGLYDAAAKRSDAFVVEDPFPAAIDFSVTTVRFVNAISNSQPMVLVARNTTTSAEVPIGTAGVAYRAAGAFVTLPPGTYDLFARTPGSPTNLITRTAVGLGGGQVYSISARGDMTVTSTTAANRPQLEATGLR